MLHKYAKEENIDSTKRGDKGAEGKKDRDESNKRNNVEGKEKEKKKIDFDYLLSSEYPPDFDYSDDSQDEKDGRSKGGLQKSKQHIEDDELDNLIENLHGASRPSTSSRLENKYE